VRTSSVRNCKNELNTKTSAEQDRSVQWQRAQHEDQKGKRAKGQKGKRAKGQKGKRAKGQTGKRAKGQKGKRAKG
jgi:hypothetical protein